MFTMPVTLSFPTTSRLMFWKKRSVSITDYDPTYKVVYLGNILTPWAKGEGCTDKPLATLWKTYAANASKIQIPMELTVCNSGMKATTKQFGLTEYWAYRVTYCCAPREYPGVFCWIYRHEGPKMKQELRCHAALCYKAEQAQELTTRLNDRLALALQEFRREKLTRQKARLSLANACYDCPSMPRRKLLLYRGTINFRPPIEMSKIAPKLTVIDEDLEEECEYMCTADSESTVEEDELFARFQLLRPLNSIGESSESDDAELSDDSASSTDDVSDVASIS